MIASNSIIHAVVNITSYGAWYLNAGDNIIYAGACITNYGTKSIKAGANNKIAVSKTVYAGAYIMYAGGIITSAQAIIQHLVGSIGI